MGRFGAHIAGGLATCVPKAIGMSAECVQVFASAPQTWRPPNIQPKIVDAFRAGIADSGLGPVILHGVYLLNPASRDDALVEKTINSVVSYLEWADSLGALGVVVHLGSAGKNPVEEGIQRVITNFRVALGRHSGDAMLLLETCAGQGATVGRSFEHIQQLLDGLDDERAGVCLDTCHIFAAGYDFSTGEGLEDVVRQFDSTIGLSRLKAIHANDSKAALGTNIDRHDNIGQGQIGEEALARFLRHPAFESLPLYLEVPGYDGEGPDRRNLNTLRRLAGVAEIPAPEGDAAAEAAVKR